MRILLIFILGLFLVSPQARAENTKSSQKAAAPAGKPVAESAQADTTAAASLPPLKTYPSRGEPWDLPVEPDKAVRIGKVYDFLNDRNVTKSGKNNSTEHEFQYFDHGAVTTAQFESRRGHYYIVSFENNAAPSDLTLRMDYRQTLSREKVTTLEIPYKSLQGSAKGRFSIAGDMYKAYGDVNSWRISVVRNGKIVAQARSFIW